MKLRSSKASVNAGIAMVCLLMPIIPEVVDAKTTYEQQQSTTIETELKQASYTENVSDIVARGYEEANETDMYEGMAIAVVDPYIDVYTGADEASEVLGRIYSNGIAQVIETADEWTKISSGNLTGYVQTSALCFGEEAAILNEDEEVILTVTADKANVYDAVGSDLVAGEVSKDQQFGASAKKAGYIAFELEGEKVYILAENVSVSYGLDNAYTNEEAEAKEAAEEAARKAAEEERRRKAEQEAAAKAAKISAGISKADIEYSPTMSATEEEIWLIATVVNWEAGNQSYEGKLAVANVVLNRVRSSKYPNTIKGVIYQNSQFSGVSDGAGGPSAKFQARLDKGPGTECIKAAMDALSGNNNVPGYLSFRALSHANYSAYASYIIIGNHCFY